MGCGYSSKTIPSNKFGLSEGTDVGNGGGGVLCFYNKGRERKVYFYDYYEAFSQGTPFNFSPSSTVKTVAPPNYLLDFKALVELIIYKISRIDKQTSTFLDLEFQNFKNNSIWLLPNEGRKSSLFYQTKDLYGEVELPKNCEFKQIIVQYKPRELGMAEYYVDQELFDEMDSINQAVAVVHELIYSLFLRNGLSGDSRPVRELVKFVFELPTIPFYEAKTEVGKALFRTYASFMQEKGLASISGAFFGQITQFNIGKGALKFCANNNIESADVRAVKVKIKDNHDLTVTGRVDLHCSNGKVKRVELNLYDEPIKVNIGEGVLECSSFIEFDKSGNVRTCE